MRLKFILSTWLLVLPLLSLPCFGTTTTQISVYYDGFEDYEDGDFVHGLNNWFSYPTDGSVVQRQIVSGGEKALQILEDTALTNKFNMSATTNMWINMQMQAVFYDGSGHPEVNPNSSALFYINAEGKFVVWDGNVGDWYVVNQDASGQLVTPVEEAEWLEFDLLMKYIDRTWDVRVNGNVLKEEIGFVDPNAKALKEISFLNGAGDAFVDEIVVNSFSISPLPDLEVSTSSIYLTALPGESAVGTFEVYNVNQRGEIIFQVTPPDYMSHSWFDALT
ncbi:MAG: hypothetical protein GX811_00665, partial [Lentisphaerae bacterium]|nr:hypothetical protein [Lentisphaerota bacterium]